MRSGLPHAWLVNVARPSLLPGYYRVGVPETTVRRPHIPAFDGVRGLLSISVALGHVVRAIGWAPRHEPLRALRFSTYFSIEFLFLLGAFSALLPVALSGRMFPARSYALRRAGRILPVYYLTIAVALALGGLLRPVTHVNAPHGASAVLAHLTFVQQEVFPGLAGFGVQGIVWTMSIVAVFYVLFPLLARPWVRHPARWLVVGTAFAIVWREVTRVHLDWYGQFPSFAVDFAFGMTAACVYARLWRGPRERRRVGTLVCGGATLATIVLLYPAGLWVAHGGALYMEPSTLAVAVPLVFSVLLVSLPFTPAAVQRPLANRAVRFVGEVSYALFLFHFIVIWLVLRFTHIPRNGALTSTVELGALVLPISLTLGWAATRWVERPLRLRAQRLAARYETPRRQTVDIAPVPTPVPAD